MGAEMRYLWVFENYEIPMSLWETVRYPSVFENCSLWNWEYGHWGTSKSLENDGYLIMFYQVAFNYKLYSNLGKSQFKHRYRNFYSAWKKKSALNLLGSGLLWLIYVYSGHFYVFSSLHFFFFMFGLNIFKESQPTAGDHAAI